MSFPKTLEKVRTDHAYLFRFPFQDALLYMSQMYELMFFCYFKAKLGRFCKDDKYPRFLHFRLHAKSNIIDG